MWEEKHSISLKAAKTPGTRHKMSPHPKARARRRRTPIRSNRGGYATLFICPAGKRIFFRTYLHICRIYYILWPGLPKTKGGMTMKKLLNGVFSSISDAELVMHNIKKETMQEEQPAANELPDTDDTPAK